MDVAFDSAMGLARRIRQGGISSRELTRHYIERIERFDPGLNAVVVRDFERALEAAERADAARARGEDLGPLHGVPMTIKEAYDLAGTPTTWGIPAFRDNVAQRDAESVRRYKQAGAHFLGKTNVPLNLADFQSYNDIYGTTRNPWDPERTPGGSSGGSSVALSAGLCGLESGSDIGGSIRNPAHFCGVYGHKPTFGVVSGDGHALPGMLAPPDIAVVGPMARSAEDLSLALDLVAGAGPHQRRGWQLSLPRPPERPLSSLSVALWPDDAVCPVSAAVSGRVQELGERLARLGARVSDAARPGIDPAESHRIYGAMLSGALSPGIPDDVFEKMQEGARALGPEGRNESTASLLDSVQTHRDWLRQSNARERLRAAWRTFFEEWDVLLCPISPTTAFPHDHTPFMGRRLVVDGKEQPYASQLFWAGLVTVSYLPSTVFPTGPAADGLPVGVQAVGAEFDDHACIAFAAAMAREFGGFVPPPGYDA